jgi:hypothetical protein
MAIRVPKNLVKEKKYTSGREFVYNNTNIEYIGYYYELNNSFYVGEEYNPKAARLILFKDKNNFLSRGTSLAIFSVVSGISSQNIKQPQITSLPVNNFIGKSILNSLKFYCKKVNEPLIIKEISEDTYKSLQQNVLYQTTYVGLYQDKNQNIDDAEKQMPGIKDFVLG